MTLYTTQAPDGSSGFILSSGEWVFDTGCSKLGENQQGTEIQVELGRERISVTVCRKAFILGKIWSRQCCQGQRESSGQEHAEGELLGKVGLAQGAAFPHLIFHELKTPFHTSTHWKIFHLQNTCSSLSDHSSWWYFFCSLEKDSSFETLIKR